MNKHSALLGIVALGLMTTTAFASPSALPPLRHAGSVSYRTGGIGIEESTAMKLDAGNHPLMLEFVELDGSSGQYSAGEAIRIKDAAGNTVFTESAAGPFMMVDLPNGKYRVMASHDGRMESRQVTLTDKTHEHLTFVWPKETPAA